MGRQYWGGGGASVERKQTDIKTRNVWYSKNAPLLLHCVCHIWPHGVQTMSACTALIVHAPGSQWWRRVWGWGWGAWVGGLGSVEVGVAGGGHITHTRSHSCSA